MPDSRSTPDPQASVGFSLPRFSVNNEVLVNVLMLVVLLAGGLFAMSLTREMFPESRPSRIAIASIYPGVQPAEIQKSVTVKIEEAVSDVDGIEKIDSTVSEGLTTTVLTLFNSVKNVDAVVQDIKSELDAIQDLPDDVETTTVRKLVPKLPVIAVAIFGEGDEIARKQAARDLRDDLLRLPGITEVEVGGIRADEISVEVQPDRLLKYDVTFNEVADAIRQSNLDISGGQLKGQRNNVSVRTLGEENRAVDLEMLVVRTQPNGSKIYLRDVASISDTVVDTDLEGYFNGQRNSNCVIYKTGDQDAIEIAQMVKAYIKGKQNQPFDSRGYDLAAAQPWYWQPVSYGAAYLWNQVRPMLGRVDLDALYERSRANPFPHSFETALHTDLSRFIEGRLDLMIRNGQSGLILVLISLLLFLDRRVAFWTAAGLPVSFLGSFIVMWFFGVTFNLLSLFGMIIVLGIIVDDAIVIGENIFRHVQEGVPPREAAIRGAEEVMWPVIVSVSTTIAAFIPLMFIKGQIGDFFKQLPLVVIAALSVSLLEALLILPAHLMHLPPRLSEAALAANARKHRSRRGWLGSGLQQLGQWFSHGTVNRLYGNVLRLALEWRYVTVALATGSLVASFGLLAGGVVPWVFIQKLDGETLVASVDMPVGSPASLVKERLKVISAAALALPEVVNVQMNVAAQVSVGGAGSEGVSIASHLGQAILELRAADDRERDGQRSSEQIVDELRRSTEKLPGVNAVIWETITGGPAGKDVEVKITGPKFSEVVEAAEQVKAKLATFLGVVDLDDNFDRGKREVQLQLRESARLSGITVNQLGDYVRSAMYGKEARRLTRNREDVKIMVRYPAAFRDSVYNLETMWIPTAERAGGERSWVPLSEVAELNETEGFGTLYRSRQRQSVKISADVQEAVSSSEIVRLLDEFFRNDIAKKFPGIELEFLGNAQEQAKSFESLAVAMPVALLIIYMMIAGLFRSYYQPIVVMLAIPFGLQGAIVGHWLTGYPMTILSAIGFVALTGIVVNDAIVLVDYVNVRMREGASAMRANLEGSQTRLRAIFLTSETTIAGLLPLLFETSFQAKFLIPMAVTICFGLLFSTLLTLLIVPSINMVFFDVLALLRIPAIPEMDQRPAYPLESAAQPVS